MSGPLAAQRYTLSEEPTSTPELYVVPYEPPSQPALSVALQTERDEAEEQVDCMFAEGLTSIDIHEQLVGWRPSRAMRRETLVTLAAAMRARLRSTS